MNIKKPCKGQATVELALILPLFLILFLGVIDFGLTMHMYSTLNEQCVQAARAGAKRIHQNIARNIFTPTTHESLANVQAVFWKYRSGIMAEANFNNITWEGVETSSPVVIVSAKYNTTLYTPVLGSLLGGSNSNGEITISASSEARKE